MSDRLLSGYAPLDSVLGGGLPANGISLIMGLPGTGKTIIAQQYAFRNARPGRPAVYFSTASEPLDKIVRFGQHLDFFDRAAMGESVFFEDLGAVAGTGGLGGVTKQIATVLKERRPGLIVIDSFKALHEFADSNGDFRGFLYELAGMLGALAVSSLWVGEYVEAEVGSLAEFAVADAILELVAERTGRREIRFLRVRKLRGSGFRSGQHAYRLSSSGLHLFPRLADLPIEAEYELGDTRASSGIAALDDLLGSGYWPGASTLVLGPSGAGKTLMGLHFIFNGGRQGEPGVIASLQENKTQLQRVTAGFGWSLDEPYVEMMYRSPVDVYIDEWVYELIQIVEQTRARRVLIDSLADLRLTATEETRFQEFTYSLVQRFSQRGISVMMTLESPELFHPERLSDSAVSHISDNVVLLTYVQEKNLINRAMTVIKSRASHHDPAIRQFRIGPRGIVLADTSLSPTGGGTALSIRLRSALQQCTTDRYWGPAGSHRASMS
ncbi:MAG TPA: ATPase domain-containing protein [Candidatus Dormibacteraeota bacterium]|nr:ATPase domain-containing protein [Candidatus Dormibacteraeota bacterium]